MYQNRSTWITATHNADILSPFFYRLPLPMATVVHSLLHHEDLPSVPVIKIELFCKPSTYLVLLSILSARTVEWQGRGPVHTHITISQPEHTSNGFPLWNACDAMTFVTKITSKYRPGSMLQIVDSTSIGIDRQAPYQASSSFALKGTEAALLVEMLKAASL